MQKTGKKQPKQPQTTGWIPLSQSTLFLLRHKSLLGLAFLLFMLTSLLTYLGFSFALQYLQLLTGDFFITAPANETILGWIKLIGWYISKYLFVLVSHVVSFYLAFLLAFSLTTPGYVFLSKATDIKQNGKRDGERPMFSVKTIIVDLIEGAKIGLFGIVVAVAAIAASFIPIIGQAAVFLMYTYYSALMFLDYPTSQLGWSFTEKLGWIRAHSNTSFRIGFLPALFSMIPILNIFLFALFFPLLTVHTTLNFNGIEGRTTR